MPNIILINAQKLTMKPLLRKKKKYHNEMFDRAKEVKFEIYSKQKLKFNKKSITVDRN